MGCPHFNRKNWANLQATQHLTSQVHQDATGPHFRKINDLFVGQKKLGGVLLESVVEGGLATAVIAGIGINTRRAERDLPSGHLEAACIEEYVGVSAEQISKAAELIAVGTYELLGSS